MNHLSEDELVLYHYGDEAGDLATLRSHVDSCEECRGALAALREDLGRVELGVPEPPASFEARLWQKLEPRIGESSRRRPQAISRWYPRLAVAASLVAAFLAGRAWPPRPGAAPLSEPVRERILLVAVGEHLERSQLVLVELANANSTEALDVSAERRLAQDLLGENRIFRQTASRAGEGRVADVLGELERVLLEVAHSPDSLPPSELRQIQNRIAAKGLLFRVRVLDSEVREREKEPAPPATRL